MTSTVCFKNVGSNLQFSFVRMQILISVFRVCAFLLDSVFVADLGFNKNYFRLFKVCAVTALLPKFCPVEPLYAKLLTGTGQKNPSDLQKSMILYSLHSLLHNLIALLSVSYYIFFPRKCIFQGTHPTDKYGK